MLSTLPKNSYLLYALVILLVMASSNVQAKPERWDPFAPLKQTSIPIVDSAEDLTDPLDYFLKSKLDSSGLDFAPEITRRQWIRRLTFDLIGLPPSPEEVKSFISDPSPDDLARRKVVDRLLASPQFGEHWARHWMDVVRYADSDGFAIDSERPTLWRFRDYLVRAFNEDKPFNILIREQLAGDEWEGNREGLIATGFYRLGPYEADNMTPANRRQDYLDEITTAIGSAFLGLTLECAKCHDHKFDPIPTLDYYQIQAFLSSVKRTDRTGEFLSEEKTEAFQRQLSKVQTENQKRVQAHKNFQDSLLKKIAEAQKVGIKDLPKDALANAFKENKIVQKKDKTKLDALKKAIAEHPEAKRVQATVCSITTDDKKAELPEVKVLVGGEVTSPGPVAKPGFLSALTEIPKQVSAALEEQDKLLAFGQRTRLATWIASDSNPLTQRVIVNRIWQKVMGVGLVATPNDFGINGSGLHHPELLDYLSKEFIEGEWKWKPLIRRLVLSRAYRSSTVNPQFERASKLDPNNHLWWRASFKRLHGEALRDAFLFANGSLNLSMGGPAFFEKLPKEMGRNFPFFTWDPSSEFQRRRRSLYMFQRRNMVHPFMEAFDPVDLQVSCSKRVTSVTTPQAFTLMNSEWIQKAASDLAQRLENEVGPEAEAKIRSLFWFTLSRKPTAIELSDCLEFFDLRKEKIKDSLKDLALILFNTNEFLYLE